MCALLRLLPEESGPILGWPSISTLTFYEGNAPVAWLRNRVAALLANSPWLAGQLQGGPEGVCVQVPSQPLASSCFVELSALGLNPGQPMDDMRNAISDIVVRRGAECLDQDEPLFRVCVARTGRDSFAVVVSLSHVLGDGHTFYRLLGALGEQSAFLPLPGWLSLTPGLPLEPRRRQGAPAAAALALGPSKLEWAGSWPAQAGSLLSGLGRPAHTWSAWEVSEAWVKAQKREHVARGATAQVPWVSTNDVLTSWFLRRGGYDYAFMTVNLRGRLPGLSEDLAGNYEGGIQFWPEEFGTPAGIRRSLLAPPRLRAGREDTPGLLQSLRGNLGVVTNWATLQQELVLPGCRQLRHLPVIGDFNLEGAMIIFTPRPGVTGVVVAERRPPPDFSEPALEARLC